MPYRPVSGAPQRHKRLGVTESLMTIVFDKRRLGLCCEPGTNDNHSQ
jgi:hypothetical protein